LIFYKRSVLACFACCKDLVINERSFSLKNQKHKRQKTEKFNLQITGWAKKMFTQKEKKLSTPPKDFCDIP
jgi:hypothetical protein